MAHFLFNIFWPWQIARDLQSPLDIFPAVVSALFGVIQNCFGFGHVFAVIAKLTQSDARWALFHLRCLANTLAMTSFNSSTPFFPRGFNLASNSSLRFCNG